MSLIITECICIAVKWQKEIRWTFTMISHRRCPQARRHMLRIFMAFSSPYRPVYVPHTISPSRDTRASRRCCDHCIGRVETRDHQRSLSSTNRIWHRPNLLTWVQICPCTCSVVNTRVRDFRFFSAVTTSMSSLKS